MTRKNLFCAGLLALASLCFNAAAQGIAAVPAPGRGPQQPGLELTFEELWEPRTMGSGVLGVVGSDELKTTPDGSDPQQPWASKNILTRWGTLDAHDGSVPGLPNVTGLGPNPYWMVRDGKLFFHAGPAVGQGGAVTGGYALISRATFPRSRRIIVETDIAVTQGSDSAFAGVALIAGEGDYRELALYRRGKVDSIDRVTPLRSSQLALRTAESVRLKIEYDPVTGFSYFIDGKLAGTEPIGHEGASFAADPHIGLYFTGNSGVKDAFVEGYVGPIRVWVEPESPS
jgi:hypothetical protein